MQERFAAAHPVTPTMSFFDMAHSTDSRSFEEIEAYVEVEGANAAIRHYGWHEPRESVFRTQSFYVELGLMRRGLTVSRGPNERHYAAPGQIIFMPPSASFRARCEPSEHRTLCVVVSQARAQAMLGDVEEAMPFCRDLRDQSVERCLLRLLKELREPGFASEVLVDSLVTGMTVEIARHLRGRGEREMTGQLAPWRLNRLKERIEADLSEQLSVGRLGAECGISERHLIRTFKNTEGITLSEYIAQRRLQRAYHMLRSSDAMIKEIAQSCGFRTASSFSTTFRRETGETPKQFRERAFRFVADGC